MTYADGGKGLGGGEDAVGVVERGNGGSELVEVRRGRGYDIEREGLWKGGLRVV